MNRDVNLLIVGAGPYGLSLAAHARHHSIDHCIVGRPMEFWRTNMPADMYLRSACDWHLDADNVHTIEYFLEAQGLTPTDVEPLSLRFYLSYVQWFQTQKQIDVTPVLVQKLDRIDGASHGFQATMEDGQVIRAKHVVIALGFKHFKHIPVDLAAILPADRFSHTCDLVDFAGMKGKRCLIIGGRQSAFEWAALLNEAGAAAVHVSHRHASPAFAEADWSWVNPLVDAMVDNPGWFRNLSPAEKDAVNHRLWAEGRLKVEPWLASRVLNETVKLWPQTQLAACAESAGGDLAVNLDNGQALVVDHIILATGYKVQIDQVPFLAQGNMLDTLITRDGYPILDEHLQTNIPNLFITSMPATQAFGPFFAFTISVRTSAKLIRQAIAHDHPERTG